MKHKFQTLLFFALVSIKLSHQHGTKGGSFSGSFSSSSSSSQSSSHSSSSSGSFSSTGSLNEVGAGFKDLAGGLAHSGANAGSFSGSLGHAGAGAGLGGSLGGAGFGGSLGGTGSKSGAFANSGSFSSSGAGLVGGVGGLKGSGVGGNAGISGSSTFGASGPSTISGLGGISCGFGNKNCAGGSPLKSDGIIGSGSYGASAANAGASSGSGITIGSGNGGFSVGDSSSKVPSGSGLGVGGGIGVTGSFGPNGPDSGKDKPTISSSGAQSGNTIKEIPVQENEEGPRGSGNNIIESSTGSGSFGTTANIEPLPLLPSIGTPSIPSQPLKPVIGSGSGTLGGTIPSGSPGREPSGNYVGGITAGPVPTTGGIVQPTKGGTYNSGLTFTTGGQAPTSIHSSSFPSHVHPTGTEHYRPNSGSFSYVKPVSQGHFGTNGFGSSTFGAGTTGSGNFVSHGGIAGGGHPKKPCCNGPFPGPIGSIHDSKPASSVPPVPSPGGSLPTSVVNTGGVFTQYPGSSSGAFPGSSGSIHESKPVTSVSSPGGSLPTSVVNTGGVFTQYPGSSSGKFPGPSGSIHESKPASSVFPVPSGGSSVPVSGANTGVFTQGSGSVSSSKGPCCQGPFPGPSGSIYDSKPASSVPPVPGFTGTVSHVSGSGVYGPHGTDHNLGVHGTGESIAGAGVLKPPCCKPIPPGPIGSIHQSKPVSSVAPVGSTGDKYTGPFPGPAGGISASVPTGSTSSNFGSQSTTQSGTQHAGSYTGPSGWNKHVTSGNGHGIHYYNVPKPAIILHPPVVTGPTQTKVIFSGYKPLNPDFISVGGTTGQISSDKPLGQPGTSPGFANVGVTVQKSDTNQVQTDASGLGSGLGSEFATGSVSTQKNDGTGIAGNYRPSGTFVTTPDSNRPSSGAGSGYATGSLEKSDTISNSGKYKPVGSFGTSFGGSFTTGGGIGNTGLVGTSSSDEKLFKPEAKPISTSSTFGTSDSGSGTGYESGFASGNVQILKPDGLVTDEKGLPSSGTFGTINTGSGGISGSSSLTTASGPAPRPQSSSNFGASPSGGGNGYQTGFTAGNVVIQKPDGSVTSGKDIPSSGTNEGSYAGSIGSGLLITTPVSSTSGTFGSAGSGSGYNNGFTTGNVVIQKPEGSVTNVKKFPSSRPSGSIAGSGSFGTSGSGFIAQSGGYSDGLQGSGTFGPSGSGSGTFGASGSGSGNSGYATGSVLIQKPDGSVTTGKDLPSGGSSIGLNPASGSGSHSFGISGSGSLGSSGSGLFGLGGNAFGLGHGHGNNAIKGSSGGASFGNYAGSHGSAGSYSGGGGFSSFGGSKGGSYAGAQSGPEAGYTGLLKNLFGKHGLGGNLGLAGSGSGSFAKSHSFAGSSSYAGASAGSYSGHY